MKSTARTRVVPVGEADCMVVYTLQPTAADREGRRRRLQRYLDAVADGRGLARGGRIEDRWPPEASR